ncbi:unnamed protein product [Closterium sp. NIES-64]|nr:unnamed protein product [Closterium sp. NIES-64]
MHPLCQFPCSFDLSRNYLTGPLIKLSGIKADLSNNYLSGVMRRSEANCSIHNIVANCFAQEKACGQLQRPPAQCLAFCGVSPTTAACGGRGVCYPDGPSLVPTCLCGARSKQFGLLRCVPFTGATSRGILPPFTVLTKGTQRETVGKFAGKPVTLFIYPPGVTSRCGLELAFTVNFTFALLPHSGRAGPSGFAFVIAATAKAGKPGGVGYSGMGARSIAITFDIKESHQRMGLNMNGRGEPVVSKVSPFMLTDGNSYTAWVDYEPGDPGTFRVFLASSNEKPEEPLLLQKGVSLCAVLRPRVKQQRAAFSFGFTASTAFQLHGILFSAVQTGKAILGSPKPHSLASVLIFRLVFSSTGAPSSKVVQTKEQALGLSLSEATFAPTRASPFSRYVSADFNLSATRADSWSIRDFHTWDNVPFLNWPVKNQNDCNGCWAYAVVASVEAAYGIAKQQSAPRLSVEGLFALMGLTDSDKCFAGGSPTQAFETLTALDASSGLTGDSDLATTYPVQAFERAQFKGYVGLMLAVQRQPVVVHIEASPTFMLYDGGDTCAYISRPLKFTELDLTALNPGLDCSKPIKAGSSVCIERSAAFAFTVPECVRYGTLTPQDTCERLLQRTGTSPGGVSAIENQWAALYRNNPGLTCSATIPSSASAVGSNIGVQSAATVHAASLPQHVPLAMAIVPRVWRV